MITAIGPTEFKVSMIYENIDNLAIPTTCKVTLRYEGTADCFLMNEDEVETAINETDVISNVASLLATPGLELSTDWHENVLETLRDDGLLEDYERDGTFEEYLAEVLADNFYDVEIIESTIEKYDYKRGACTLSAELHTTVDNLLQTRPTLFGWKAEIENGQAIIHLEG